MSDTNDAEANKSLAAHQFSLKDLGAKKNFLDQDKTAWKCSQCSEEFSNCVDFAIHLQEHLRPLLLSSSKIKKTKPQDSHEKDVNEQNLTEMHVVISSEEAQQYNFRRIRKKSRIVLENEEQMAPKRKKSEEKLKKSPIKKVEEKLVIRDVESSEDDDEDDGEIKKEVVIINGMCGAEKVALANSSSETELECEICNKVFSMVLYLFRHLEKHTGRFHCHMCKKVFARNESLKRHECHLPLIVEGSSTLPFPCPHCNKSFGSKKLYDKHVAKHSSDACSCSKCSATFSSQEAHDNHICDSDKEYECEICLKKFSHEINLNRHLPLHSDAHKCTICHKTLRCQKSLDNHMSICSRIEILETVGKVTCDACSQEFTDASAFRRHVTTHKFTHVCDKCGAKFRNSMMLAIHACSTQVCKRCLRIFKDIKKLEKHLLSSCGSDFSCNKCLRPFQSEEDVEGHECAGYPDSHTVNVKFREDIKSDKNSLICEVCGSLFSTNASLNLHRVLHGEKKFECKECGKKFHRKDLLQDHEAVHKEPSVECVVCHKLFKTKNSRDKHMALHVGIKRFKCDQCDKEFHQKGNLRKHMETHNPYIRYECYVCNKSFSSKFYLKTHQLEHSQGKIHSCNVCGRSFLTTILLRKHQKMFHGPQTYVCKYCGLPLKLRDSLKRHLNKKHANVKQQWNSLEALEAMVVTNSEPRESQICVIDSNLQLDDENCQTATDQLDNVDKQDVLLNVTGLGNETLEKAIADGKAQVRQGSIPNTIVISLPYGMEGIKLSRSIVQTSDQLSESDITIDQSQSTVEIANQNAMKLFELEATSDCYVENADDVEQAVIETSYVQDAEHDLIGAESKLVISGADQVVGTDRMIVQLEDQDGSDIIINQVDGTAQELTEDGGQVLLYVVADENS